MPINCIGSDILFRFDQVTNAVTTNPTTPSVITTTNPFDLLANRVDMPIQSYPYLAQNEFNSIVQEFQEIYENAKGDRLNDWQSVEIRTYVILIEANFEIARLIVPSQTGSIWS